MFMNGHESTNEQEHPQEALETDIVESTPPTPRMEASLEEKEVPPPPSPQEKKTKSISHREKKVRSPEKVPPSENELEVHPTSVEDVQPPAPLSQDSAPLSQEKAEAVSTPTSPPPAKEKEKEKTKSGKKFGGILSSKKSKFQGEEVSKIAISRTPPALSHSLPPPCTLSPSCFLSPFPPSLPPPLPPSLPLPPPPSLPHNRLLMVVHHSSRRRPLQS